MTCPRCKHGLMFQETYFDLTGVGKFTQWHCLICGHYLDEAMERNRALVKAGVQIDVRERCTVKPATSFDVEV